MADRVTAETWQKYGYTPPVHRELPPAMYLPRADCFAFEDGIGCAVLKKTYCCHIACGFYKRKEEMRDADDNMGRAGLAEARA